MYNLHTVNTAPCFQKSDGWIAILAPTEEEQI